MNPILFNDGNIKAILTGKQTITHRLVAECPVGFEWVHKRPGDTYLNTFWDRDRQQWVSRDIPISNHCVCYAGTIDRSENPQSPHSQSIKMYWESTPHLCPYGRKGDRLWAREAHQFNGSGGAVWFRAGIPEYRTGIPTGNWLDWPYDKKSPNRIKWRPSIHMPKWASRVYLEIVNVKVERIQDISSDDAIAAGIERNWLGSDCPPEFKNEWRNYLAITEDDPPCYSVIDSFSTYWDSLNSKDNKWKVNPLVFSIEFKVLND
jgi:hypothetical protein